METGDFYALAVSWEPSLCCAAPSRCTESGLTGASGLVPHGLWPSSILDKNRLLYCDTTGKRIDTTRKNKRERHEWAKHGSCSGLAREFYFAEEARLMNGKEVKGLESAIFIHAVPPVAKKQSSLRSIPVEAIVRSSERQVAVKASKDCKFQELTVCFERTAKKGVVGKQIDCPNSIMRNRHTNRCAAVFLETDSKKCSAVEEELLRSVLKR